ncbi:D-isomer specific 2-hydroxyacid dehydrogenase family protein [Lacrimispora sp.]|uniref:D-isomer specific 2-hydroxyacid dehydrogenase family protein n=1 Tax=Lacrimispora sp. TaxID=2719234 RepID=UPI00399535D9
MGKITAFGVRTDELPYFQNYAKGTKIVVNCIKEALDQHTVEAAAGSMAVSVPGSNAVPQEVIEKLGQSGIKYLSVRSAGYNLIDRTALKNCGIRLANVSYSVNSVADFTVMLMLMSLRKVKQIINRNDVQDYTLNGLQGRELKNLTVGIIGTGKIGAAVARDLTGFKCKIIAYDVYHNENLQDILSYVSLEELLANSDVITIHVPLFENNYHMINAEAIDKMKDGVCLINCSRGELIDTDALIAGIESGKIGAAGLDVLEGERKIFQTDHRLDILNNHSLSILRAFPNVLVTPHASFYTDQAVKDMVDHSLEALISFMENGTCVWEIV